MRAYLPIDICERGGVDPVMVVHVSPMVGTETTETMTGTRWLIDCRVCHYSVDLAIDPLLPSMIGGNDS